MDRLVRRPFFLVLVAATALFAACGEDKKKGGTSCTDDSGCERGTVCESGACSIVACTGLNDCPGSGRTCIYTDAAAGSGSCGAKECTAASDCPDGSACKLEGGNRFSCVSAPACDSEAACSPYGTGWQCCSGVCAASCSAREDGGVPTDAGPGGDAQMSLPPDGGSVTDAAGPKPDMAGPPPGDARVCGPCTEDADCASLGPGAACITISQAHYCAPACDNDSDCEAPFTCVPGAGRCLPPLIKCGCFADGCPAGQICDPATSACTTPKPACSPCGSDAECAAGLKCGALGATRYCLEECPDCPAGTTCGDGLCKPDSGLCDPCGGQCGGATPVCVPNPGGGAGTCGQCGNGHACPQPGQVCDMTNHCVDAAPNQDCIQDADCAAPTPWCLQGACVECFEDAQCGPRRACDPGRSTCIDSPCGGVTCQAGSVCDPGMGRCSPGCMADEDCGDPMTAGCNQETGQCFNRDGSCDDAAAVCPPGSMCQSLAPGLIPGTCTCQMAHPEDQAAAFCNSGDLVACPPGLLCSYFAFPPGAPLPAVGTCGPDLFGICAGLMP